MHLLAGHASPALISQLHCYAYNVGGYIRIVRIVWQTNRPSVGNRGRVGRGKERTTLIVGYVQLPDTAGASAQHRPLNC